MVQELQHSVPEEFFNLTQLAEVTLIAGKLSTTDINEIKNYINKSEEDCHTNGNENELGNSRVLTHHNNNYESTKKKWKNHWENFKDRETQFKNVNYTSSRVQAYENSPSSVSPKTYAFLSSSCSSVSSDCDDDSTKSLLSYSHKVFDRKKQRSFKQSSTESEYEFHFECQRPPYATNIMKYKDTPCDMNATSETLKINTIENVDEIKCDELLNIDDDKNLNDSFDGCIDLKNDPNTLTNTFKCPECGKKYSTSMHTYYSFS